MKYLLVLVLSLYIINAKYVEEKLTVCDTRLIPEPMTVQGQAVSKLLPEIVVIDFTVQTISKDASQALEENSKIVKKTIDQLLKNHDVTEKELNTANLNIQPQYESIYDRTTQNHKQVFKGYQVVNNIIVKTIQLDNVGSIIDSAIKSGVNRVNSVNFDVKGSTKKQIKDGLIKQAVADAKSRANLALEELGHKIVGVKSVSIDSYNEPQYYAKSARYESLEMDMNDGGVETQVFSGNISVQARVTVSFVIEAEN